MNLRNFLLASSLTLLAAENAAAQSISESDRLLREVEFRISEFQRECEEVIFGNPTSGKISLETGLEEVSFHFKTGKDEQVSERMCSCSIENELKNNKKIPKLNCHIERKQKNTTQASTNLQWEDDVNFTIHDYPGFRATSSITEKYVVSIHRGREICMLSKSAGDPDNGFEKHGTNTSELCRKVQEKLLRMVKDIVKKILENHDIILQQKPQNSD